MPAACQRACGMTAPCTLRAETSYPTPLTTPLVPAPRRHRGGLQMRSGRAHSWLSRAGPHGEGPRFFEAGHSVAARFPASACPPASTGVSASQVKLAWEPEIRTSPPSSPPCRQPTQARANTSTYNRISVAHKRAGRVVGLGTRQVVIRQLRLLTRHGGTGFTTAKDTRQGPSLRGGTCVRVRAGRSFSLHPVPYPHGLRRQDKRARHAA
jgi:hypothetical protein